MGTRRLGLALLVALASACAQDDPPGAVCGDGTCQPGESTAACAQDCPATGPYCGDGACTAGESHASCAVDCPTSGAFCGDGACNGSETSASCATDCPATACTWTDAETCAGETICVNQSCVPAYGRVYAIHVVQGQIAATMLDGSSWDAMGGAPDAACTVTLNGVELLVTATSADTHTPSWNASASRELPPGSELQVSCEDVDVAANDRILGCTFALTADVLHVRDYRCAESGSWVDLSFLTS